MIYAINDALVTKSGMLLSEFLLLLSIKAGGDYKKTLQSLVDKKAISTSGIISPEWNDKCDKILLDSEKTLPKEDELVDLAEKLMDTFPSGKKPGTPYYWKGNKREIVLKLRSFFKLYGTKYEEDKILKAASDYVASFHGNYKFMRLLKYFIWKRELDGEVSELASFIDNLGQEEEENDSESWLNDLK